MNLPPCLLASLGKRFEKILPVHIVQKDILTAVSSAHKVVHRPGILNANYFEGGAGRSDVRTKRKPSMPR